MKIRSGIAGLSLLVLLTPPAIGHDLRGVINQELKSSTLAIQAASLTADVETRSVLANLRLWPVPRTITICFIGGTEALRKRVSAAMRSKWQLADLTDGRLDYDKKTFDEVPDCPAVPTRAQNIRVGFVAGSGHWSYVGAESLRHAQSMNFDGFTETTPGDTDFARTVAHEMGHALGLEHEHQSPKSPECYWNFQYISTAYQWDSDAQMHQNFDKLTDSIYRGKHTYLASPYDKLSLMHYVFEKEAFIRDSPCYKKDQNNVPSDQDLNAISVAYSSARSTQDTAKGRIPQMLNDPALVDLRELLQIKQQLLTQ